MTRWSFVLSLALQLFSAAALALEGDFDRSAEAARYVSLVENAARDELIPICKDIYVSGLTDPKLSDALSVRLLRDNKTLRNGVHADSQYGQWLSKALASTGTAQAVTTLQQVKASTAVKSMKSESDNELELIEWHRSKNRIMASRVNHQDGQDERNSRLLNLLKSDDFSFKAMAADRISWEKRLDPRLLDEMAAQLPRYMDTTQVRGDLAQSRAMGQYAKLLGFSGNAKYLATLEQVINSKAGNTLKKHAKQARTHLKELTTSR